MRVSMAWLALPVLLPLGGGALAGSALPTPPPPPLPISDIDVPQDRGPQHASVLVREFPVGGQTGWHVHPGVEIAYLLSGEITLEEVGKPLRHLHPGDSFTMPRGVAHNGANVAAGPSRVIITYVVDKDAPVRTTVDAPPGP